MNKQTNDMTTTQIIKEKRSLSSQLKKAMIKRDYKTMRSLVSSIDALNDKLNLKFI
jgi:hypothetical protein